LLALPVIHFVGIDQGAVSVFGVAIGVLLAVVFVVVHGRVSLI
jgi:hypothetical protein